MIIATAHTAIPNGRTFIEMEERFASVTDAKLFVKTCEQLGYHVQIGAQRTLSDNDREIFEWLGAFRN